MQYSRIGTFATGAFLLILLAAPFAVSVSSADRITLNSGRTLNGAVVQQTNAEYVFKTEVGTLRIARGDVREFLSEETQPAEVDGDVALAKRDYNTAAKHYATALQTAPKGGKAEARLRTRISQINQLQQQTRVNNVGLMYEQARSLMAARRYDEAYQTLEQLRQSLNPEDETSSAVRKLLAEVHYTRALIARDAVNELEVEKQLKASIEADPTYYKALLAYGELLLKATVTEQQGIDMILQALRSAGNQLSEEEVVKFHYIVATKFFQKGDYESASTNFAEALRAKGKYPQYADALERTVESYIKMGEKNVSSDFQKTIDNLNEALKLNPENKDAHFLLGRIYRDTGRTENALIHLRKVIELDKAYPAAQHYLANAYMDAKDYDNALKHLDLELTNDPSNYDALADRAEVHITLAEYDKAAKDLAAAQGLEPNRWRAFLLAAQLAFRQEQNDAARDNLMRVLAIKPDAIEAHIQMGKVLLAQKQAEPAKQWFSNVVQFLESRGRLNFRYRQLMAEAQTELGAIDLAQDSPRQAETRLLKALEFVQNFPDALNRIGDVKRRLGSDAGDQTAKLELFREAESFYKKAINADPKDPNYYLSIGILYHNNIKDPGLALKNYEKYVELGGKDQEVNKWIVEVGGTPKEGIGESSSTLLLPDASSGLSLTTATVSTTTDSVTGLVVTTTETATGVAQTTATVP